VIRTEEFAGTTTAGLNGLAGGLKVTPVLVHKVWEASAEAGPLAATLYTRTGKLFGFVARRITSAEPPGTREVAVESPLTKASTSTVCMVPFAAEPFPIPMVDQ